MATKTLSHAEYEEYVLKHEPGKPKLGECFSTQQVIGYLREKDHVILECKEHPYGNNKTEKSS